MDSEVELHEKVVPYVSQNQSTLKARKRTKPLLSHICKLFNISTSLLFYIMISLFFFILLSLTMFYICYIQSIMIKEWWKSIFILQNCSRPLNSSVNVIVNNITNLFLHLTALQYVNFFRYIVDDEEASALKENVHRCECTTSFSDVPPQTPDPPSSNYCDWSSLYNRN